MIQPRPRKFRKPDNGQLLVITKQYESTSKLLSFGTHGLQALEYGIITPKQIEVLRRTLKGHGKSIKNKIKLWIRVYPDYPRTAKPAEVRIGRGKGNVSKWVSVIKPGKILAEIVASPREQESIHKVLNRAVLKLPIKAQVVSSVYASRSERLSWV